MSAAGVHATSLRFYIGRSNMSLAGEEDHRVLVPVWTCSSRGSRRGLVVVSSWHQKDLIPEIRLQDGGRVSEKNFVCPEIALQDDSSRFCFAFDQTSRKALPRTSLTFLVVFVFKYFISYLVRKSE